MLGASAAEAGHSFPILRERVASRFPFWLVPLEYRPRFRLVLRWRFVVVFVARFLLLERNYLWYEGPILPGDNPVAGGEMYHVLSCIGESRYAFKDLVTQGVSEFRKELECFFLF